MHCPSQMDGFVRLNGEATEDLSVSTAATSSQHSPQIKDVPSAKKEEDVLSEQIATNEEAVEQTPTPQTEGQTPPLLAEEQTLPPQVEERTLPSQAEEQTPPQQAEEQKPPPQTENVATFSGSAISSLIGGRNRIITTTIVTELTQTRVEPRRPDNQSNGQVISQMTC